MVRRGGFASPGNEHGTLALVVGPSGAGKDTLINAARSRLGGDGRFVFARRVITRIGDGTAEQHDSMPADAFASAEAEGAFLLSWHAHGLGYGIPATNTAVLEAGGVLVANVSRTVIQAAEALFERVAVVHVTAPEAVLADRIAARGRESASEIRARLARQAPLVTSTARIMEVENGDSLAAATERFVEVLLNLCQPEWETSRGPGNGCPGSADERR